MRVYIGWDEREQPAFDVAVRSLRVRASVPVEAIPLRLARLQDAGMMPHGRFQTRNGKIWDTVSEAFCSTEFAISRFLVPLIGHAGWVLFVDCDVVFLADVAELFALRDDRFAAMCVQHDYQPSTETKMDGQVQLPYARKNWTSVMLWNCDHPAVKRMSLGYINAVSGRTLHKLSWLNPDEIGALPAEWNWLVGEQPKPADPKIAHFTLGTPNLTPELAKSEHAEIWWEAARA